MTAVPLLVPTIGGREAELVAACIASTYVSTVGPMVREFEVEFAQQIGTTEAVTCASGTAALHLALAAAGVGPGDEVFVSELTFVASANPIKYVGGLPVLIDSRDDDWNLDTGAVLAELRRRQTAAEQLPAAIVAVHLLGQPADLGELAAACTAAGIPLIEDAAESFGAGWITGGLAGRATGTAGTIGCFSFNGNKTITTGAGGAVVSRDPAILARIRHLTQQAKVANSDYVHDEVGFNYGMTNLSAALGLAQLERSTEILAAKEHIANRYDDALRELPGVRTPLRDPARRHGNWLYGARFRDRATRDHVRQALQSRGIESRPLWPPLRRQRVFSSAPRIGGSTSCALADEVLCLPTSAGLIETDQNRVIDLVIDAVAAASAVSR